MKTQTFTQNNIFKSFSLFGLFMILTLTCNTVTAQTELTVKGIVSDEAGPLEYATVVLKGTSIGTNTDENGEFTFPQKLKENDVLVVIQLGYKKREFTIGPNTEFVEINLSNSDITIVGSLMIGNNKTITKEKTN